MRVGEQECEVCPKIIKLEERKNFAVVVPRYLKKGGGGICPFSLSSM
jgi:hypothetical protein